MSQNEGEVFLELLHVVDNTKKEIWKKFWSGLLIIPAI